MTTVTRNTQEHTFAKMAGAHIDTANQHAQVEGPGLAGVAILHAAARYNAFICATVVTSGAELKAAREAHLADLSQQFREFLEHHYDQYVEDYAALMVPAAPSQS